MNIQVAGVYSGGATPDPVPNSEVKPVSGNGTARVALWKSSTMPALIWTHLERGGFFLFEFTHDILEIFLSGAALVRG